MKINHRLSFTFENNHVIKKFTTPFERFIRFLFVLTPLAREICLGFISMGACAA